MNLAERGVHVMATARLWQPRGCKMTVPQAAVSSRALAGGVRALLARRA